MAMEVLEIPEENLEEVITVIRFGLKYCDSKPNSPISDLTYIALSRWCDKEELYLQEMKIEEK